MDWFITVVTPYEVGETLIASPDEARLYQYLDFIGQKGKVIKVNDELLNKYIEKNGGFVEYLEFELYDAGSYITNADAEYISYQIESECESMAQKLKYIKKHLKYYRGKKAQELKKAIDAFIKEECENDYFTGVDDEDVTGKLMQKIKLDKIGRKLLRLQFRK